ncbi:hypothetical protein M878_36985 [Streptomyces roseochromogenus subsp. oscitans DS 12.976]|uniref:PcRGLX/YetA-like C-terminal alpha/alpha toroid domain-containing protein n=1 Tax=Streptomyces roseochromogenus subsp. oscitans DS 12.976 TaxID=1352936 RepID=V6JQT0_STRRC|nr:hypothetical protein M878_36985 [Streptomyces roseochromogenus subsp. oscitans DS 12.976]
MTTRYSWWGAEERAKKINRTIALFEKKYPKVGIRTDFQMYQSFWEKFQTQAAGGNPPDVFQNAVTFLRKYDKRGIPLDLKSQVQAGNLTPDHFRDGVTKAGEVDGKQLGIPVGSNTMALVVDKKVFREVDVYHLGTWAGLSTRHGVQHFGDSARQQRIANTTYRRFCYFLTADERVGDLMHANLDSDESSPSPANRWCPSPAFRRSSDSTSCVSG